MRQKGDFRARFPARHKQKWKEVIKSIREIGIEAAYNLLQRAGGDWEMVLTQEVRDASGNIITQRYSKQNDGQTPTDGMDLVRLSKSPNGGEWKIYARQHDSAIAYTELITELAQPVQPLRANIVTGKQLQKSGLCLMPMLTDHHFGKIAFSYKGDSWSLNEARDVWNAAIDYYIDQVKGENITRIIFPVGNDLLHTNSDMNTTKRGTQMEVSNAFANLYAYVRDVVTASVMRLSEIAPVEVVIVQGNHDEDAVLRLGDYLEGMFYGSNLVKVNNKKYRRKYTKFGACGIGFTHGEKVKPRDLHGAFSNDMPSIFSAAKYRYFFVGHLHKNAGSTFATYDERRDEYMGTQIEVCPSLCPTDRWHFDMNFTGNQRSSKAVLFHKDKGRVQELYFSI